MASPAAECWRTFRRSMRVVAMPDRIALLMWLTLRKRSAYKVVVRNLKYACG
jgi:hypothetical protein